MALVGGNCSGRFPGVAYKQLSQRFPQVNASDKTLAQLPAEGLALYREAQVYLLEIDRRIRRLDRALRRLQPPASGRVRVAWRKMGENSVASCKPVLVRWTRQGEIWRSTKLGLANLVQKAPRSGPFYVVREEIRETLRLLALLLRKRNEAQMALMRLEQAVRLTVRRNQGGLEEADEAIGKIVATAEMLPYSWKDGSLHEYEHLRIEDLSHEEREALAEEIG